MGFWDEAVPEDKFLEDAIEIKPSVEFVAKNIDGCVRKLKVD